MPTVHENATIRVNQGCDGFNTHEGGSGLVWSDLWALPLSDVQAQTEALEEGRMTALHATDARRVQQPCVR